MLATAVVTLARAARAWSSARRGAIVAVLAPVLALAGATFAAAIGATDAQAADDAWPARTVRIVVPYGAGGAGDLTIRVLANKLSENLRQPFVVENRPGAGGMVAMRTVLGAAADGYTLGEMGNGQAISTTLFNLPYDVLGDFAQVSIAARFSVLLVVGPGSPFRTVTDVIAAARAAPGKLNLGAINPGSTQNLSAHLFQELSGARFEIVTYRTTPDLVTALLRGEVDLGFDYYAGLESTIGPDKLRVIATSGEERDPVLKDVPTVKESGLPDYAAMGWNGLVTASAVAPGIVEKLSAEVRRALSAPDVQERMLQLGLDARGTTPQEMRARMTGDIAKWRRVIENAQIPSHRTDP